MTGTAYRLARGVRLRREDDGTTLLLVPEGIVELNEPAAAALELADGTRTANEIVAALGERFDDPDGALDADVRVLLADLAERGFVTT
ncbi:MAG: pyrroloquinoline quinone biosynthesis peptide chaperone PqqD [Candidatus Eremiobacteraeota bacterium]|nr:pyrroloquinoline quinone biosynthesis peptide chaperone PqqD [Candidatus Eremiobacteraeota bacterium]